MHSERINRRVFFQTAVIGATAAGVAGCGGVAAPVAGPVAQAVRVVVTVGWKYLTRIAKAVMSRNGQLVLAALVGSEEVGMTAQLTEAQQKVLRKGGVLILRTEDGKEHEVPFTTEP